MKVGIKKCGVCEEEKPLEEFHPNKSCNGGVAGTCRKCTRVRIAKWYQDNKQDRQKAQNEANRRKKEFWIKEMGGKCVDCSGVFPYYIYDFHHIDGTKELNPSKAISGGYEKAKAELSKCVLLCSNCHRTRHFGGTS